MSESDSRYSHISILQVRSLIGFAAKPRDIAIVKKVHHFSHAIAEEMKRLFRDAGQLTTGIEASFNKVYDA